MPGLTHEQRVALYTPNLHAADADLFAEADLDSPAFAWLTMDRRQLVQNAISSAYLQSSDDTIEAIHADAERRSTRRADADPTADPTGPGPEPSVRMKVTLTRADGGVSTFDDVDGVTFADDASLDTPWVGRGRVVLANPLLVAAVLVDARYR